MFLFVTLQIHAQSWSELIKIVAPDRANNDNFGYSVAVDGDYAVVGSPYDSEDADGLNYKNKAGAAYILKNTSGSWSVLKKIVASDRAALDNFGLSVSISGNYIIVGAPFEDEDADGLNTISNTGSVYIFEKDLGGIDNWGENNKIVATYDRSADDNFGQSVSISGDLAIVGAPNEDEDDGGNNTITNAGAAYILMNISGTWYQISKKFAPDRAMYDNYGLSVAISGDYAIVGSPYDSEDENNANTISQAGSAYILYKDEGSTNGWGVVNKIVASDRGVEDNYGLSVAISGDYAVVGSPYEDEDATGANTVYNAGSVYIINNNLGIWTQVQKLVASDRASQDIYGYSVAISGDNACIGAYWDNSKAGSAYFIQNNGGTWSELQNKTASDISGSDNFGTSVAISGNYALIGSPLEDEDETGANTLTNSGSSYIFSLQSPPLITSNPSDQTNVCPLGNAIFNVTGDNIDSYKWQVSQNSGVVWTDITDNSIYSGSQTNSLSVTCYVSLNNHQYRCVLTNTAGSTTSNTALLTISDNEAPVPDVANLSNVTAECEVTSLTAPTATDACAGTITGTHNATLPITTQGITVVTWTYDDGNGNTYTQTQNVVIDDVTDPVTPTLADVTGECSATATAPTTTDACAGTITGTTSDDLTYDVQGTHVITWNFADGNGNSIDVNQNVVIEDVTNPTIVCVENQTINLTSGQTAYTVDGVEFDATGDDNCNVASVENDLNTSATLDGESLAVGTYTINWTVTDDAGNLVNCSTEIVVNAYAGINNITDINISLYPNPSDGQFTIENAEGFDIVITDVTGKTVYSTTRKLENSKTQIDLSNQASGIYFIRFIDENKTATLKFIKE